jgi:fatty-acyl-CoA synthase
VLDFCRGKIASFKIPKHIRFVKSWPMSATKIHKGKLREQIIQELAADI